MNGRDLAARRRELEALGIDPGSDVLAYDPAVVKREFAEIFGPEWTANVVAENEDGEKQAIAAMFGIEPSDVI